MVETNAGNGQQDTTPTTGPCTAPNPDLIMQARACLLGKGVVALNEERFRRVTAAIPEMIAALYISGLHQELTSAGLHVLQGTDTNTAPTPRKKKARPVQAVARARAVTKKARPAR